MEEFFDIFLFLLLLVVIILIGGLIYLAITAPRLAYVTMVGVLAAIGGGGGLWIRHIIRKKRLGSYYLLLKEISRRRKEISRTFRKLDASLRRGLKPLRSKIFRLCREAKTCIWKIYDIEKTLSALEAKQTKMSSRLLPDFSGQDTAKRILHDQSRYYQNIHTIESSQRKYVEEVQQVLQFLQTFNAQLITLRYASNQTDIQDEIAETLDELLVEMQALEEIS